MPKSNQVCEQFDRTLQSILVRRLDGDLGQTQAERLATRTNARLENDCKHATEVDQFDSESPDARRVAPDVGTGDASKLEAPATCDWKGAQYGQELIATVECTIETLVAVAPDAVDRSHTVGFTENFFEVNLRLKVSYTGNEK